MLLAFAGPTKLASMLFHEMFHHLWQSHLSEAARNVLTTAVAQGAEWPGGYFGSVSERVARLFESWAWARLEGMPHTDPLPMSVAGIFDFVWSGGLADNQIQLGLVPGADALRVRRGLPALPPPEPEFVEPQQVFTSHVRIDDIVCDAIWDGCAFLVCLIGRGIRLAVA